MSYKLTRRLNNHITRTSSYVPGKTFKLSQVRQMWKRYFPAIANADPATRVGYQTIAITKKKINDLLQLRGMYMKASANHTKFEILTRQAVPNKVKHFENISECADRRATTLNAAYLTHGCAWTKLSVDEMRDISKYINKVRVGPAY